MAVRQLGRFGFLAAGKRGCTAFQQLDQFLGQLRHCRATSVQPGGHRLPRTAPTFCLRVGGQQPGTVEAPTGQTGKDGGAVCGHALGHQYLGDFGVAERPEIDPGGAAGYRFELERARTRPAQ